MAQQVQLAYVTTILYHVHIISYTIIGIEKLSTFKHISQMSCINVHLILNLNP